MSRPAFITTSWDDGHPNDFRVAEMLACHGLAGTFYIPRRGPKATVSEAEIRQLSQTFEIGSHTIDHHFLTDVDLPTATAEIRDSKTWVEQITGKPCEMFCPPAGKFDSRHLKLIEERGYAGLRTVELLSLDYPRPIGGIRQMPTTIHAYPHRPAAYGRNLAKRFALGNLWLYIRHGRFAEWGQLAARILPVLERRGGVFHLWGHSWELEETGQWQRLDDVLKMLADAGEHISRRTNTGVCQAESIECTTAVPQPR